MNTTDIIGNNARSVEDRGSVVQDGVFSDRSTSVRDCGMSVDTMSMVEEAFNSLSIYSSAGSGSGSGSRKPKVILSFSIIPFSIIIFHRFVGRVVSDIYSLNQSLLLIHCTVIVKFAVHALVCIERPPPLLNMHTHTRARMHRHASSTNLVGHTYGGGDLVGLFLALFLGENCYREVEIKIKHSEGVP